MSAMEHLENGLAQAIVANSGNANACAPEGMENAKRMAAAAAKAAGVDEDKVLVGSTGVIGQRLNVETIEAHMDEVASKLEASAAASQAANNAIMTTDTVEKTVSCCIYLRRQNLPYRRHCKGLRHDSSEHGHHAVLHHDRLCH